MKTVTMLSSILALGLLSAGSAHALTDVEQLGKSIFFDNDLSINNNQSCAACHGPTFGWTGPNEDINATGGVYEGSIPGRFGNRKPPSSAYATPSPILYFVVEKAKNKNKTEILFIGGNFWDGRATGEALGNPAADQARGPFLNPVEQALPDRACVVYRVCNASTYPVSLEQVYPGSCNIVFPVETNDLCTAGDLVPLDQVDREQVETAYDNIALAIAAYEDSPEVNQFSSKYDAFLAGIVELSKEEKKGLNLFKSTGKCANCHILDPGPNGEPPLLTDFTFDNLGVPRNPENPWYAMLPEFNPDGINWIDKGLGGFLASRMEYEQYAAENNGKQKVPTLRNVDLRPLPGSVKAYTHNGYFKTLKQVVHFYNTRDMKPVCPDDSSTEIDESLFTSVEDAMAQGCWPKPEVAANVNTSELGSLNLTDDQEDAIVAFMKTLSDGYLP